MTDEKFSYEVEIITRNTKNEEGRHHVEMVDSPASTPAQAAKAIGAILKVAPTAGGGTIKEVADPETRAEETS